MSTSVATPPIPADLPDADAVLDFWFVEHGQADWFASSDVFDAKIAARFSTLHAAASRGELAAWRASVRGRLAEILVLDQFSRQLSRRRAEAFACDMQALTLAQELVSGGHLDALEGPERVFACLPFMHAESLAIQEAGLALFADMGEQILGYARDHRDIVARFGRFPHRNEALGRENTPEEVAYLAEGGDRYGQ